MGEEEAVRERGEYESKEMVSEEVKMKRKCGERGEVKGEAYQWEYKIVRNSTSNQNLSKATK